ncbi:hypothetical protein ACTNCI_11540, partial [Mitsuokella jalaludinii]|uniref:hypothetical protein n=1 Tax=Mitsuokella jalaludinii TaxID=187979 RepID=UPI003F88BFEF
PSLVFWFSDFIIHRKGGYAILLCFKSCKVLLVLLSPHWPQNASQQNVFAYFFLHDRIERCYFPDRRKKVFS